MHDIDMNMARPTTPAQSGLNIVHLNAGSLLAGAKFEMFKIQVESSKVDILGISESWLTEAIPDGMVKLEKYTTFRLDRQWNDNGDPSFSKRGGGLICYINNDLPACGEKFGHLNSSSKDLEMQWLLVKIKNLRDIVIINIYRPPQGDYKKACKIINESIAKANLKDNAEIYLMGDFNIDLKDKNSPATKELLFATGSYGLSPQIKETTRFSYRNGVSKKSCIDQIYTNSSLITEKKVLDWNISDHHSNSSDRYGWSY